METPRDNNQTKYLTTAEVAELFRVSERTIRHMVADCKLLGFRVGQRKILIPYHSVRSYIKNGIEEMQGADLDADE